MKKVIVRNKKTGYLYKPMDEEVAKRLVLWNLELKIVERKVS